MNTFSCQTVLIVMVEGDITTRFFRWMTSELLLPVYIMKAGPKDYMACHDKEDADKIVEWLAREGTVKKENQIGEESKSPAQEDQNEESEAPSTR